MWTEIAIWLCKISKVETVYHFKCWMVDFRDNIKTCGDPTPLKRFFSKIESEKILGVYVYLFFST